MITERIDKRKQEKEELRGQLAIEAGKQVVFTAPQIEAFLYSLKKERLTMSTTAKALSISFSGPSTYGTIN